MRTIDISPPITSETDFARVYRFLNGEILNQQGFGKSGAEIKPTIATFSKTEFCDQLVVTTKRNFEFTPAQSDLILTLLNQASLGYQFSVEDKNFE